MRLPARYQAVIELLDMESFQQEPLDRLLHLYFRKRRYIGAQDRRAITEIFYNIIRRQLYLEKALVNSGINEFSGRLFVLASLIERPEGTTVDEIFSGNGYGPSPLTEPEARTIEMLKSIRFFSPRFPLPSCLEYLNKIYPADFLMAFENQAAIDLRVNTLKTTRANVLENLSGLNVEATLTPFSPVGIRLCNRMPLENLQAYQAGHFEIQDEASQLAGYFCGVNNNDEVLDMCAGAGGKTLHLAALMQNQGQIVASDISESRLNRSAARFQRAGVKNVVILPPEKACQRTYDCVLVDVPCSGSGTWRRHPELKNRLTESSLKEYIRLQKEILEKAASLVRSGGKIVYITCSIIPEENEHQVLEFIKKFPAFRLVDPLHNHPEFLARFMEKNFLKLSPATSCTDGFFGAVLLKDTA